MKETFNSLSDKYQNAIIKAVNALSQSREREEVEVANAEVHKLVTSYTKELKKLLDDISLRIIADHANIQKVLNDRINLDPDKATVSYTLSRHIIKWEITLFGKERYFYVSKRDEAIDINRFYEWASDILQ